MAINSVSSSTVSPSAGTLSQSVRPQQQVDQAKQADQAQQAEEPEPNKPVVNTQGQMTGTLVNTTA